MTIKMLISTRVVVIVLLWFFCVQNISILAATKHETATTTTKAKYKKSFCSGKRDSKSDDALNNCPPKDFEARTREANHGRGAGRQTTICLVWCVLL